MKDTLMTEVNLWLDNPRTRYAVSTCTSYRWALSRFARWADRENVDPAMLTPEQLAAWLRVAGKSKNYKRLLGNAVRSYLRFAYGPGHPATDILLPGDDAPAGRSLTFGQLEQLTESFDRTTLLGWRNLSLVLLMMDTGMRSAEICRLESRRVNLVKREIKVIAKGGEWRDGAFTETTAEAMQTWFSMRREVAKRGVPNFYVSVMGSRPGTGLTTGGLRCLFRVWGEEAGIGPLSPHDLRRTMSILYYEGGAPDKAIMDAGGWTDARTLHRYQRGSRVRSAVRFSPTNGLGAQMDSKPKEELKQKTPRYRRGSGS